MKEINWSVAQQRKQKKDPNAPKRPSSAYMQWLNDHRAEFKQENPGISITELSKLAGQKWKSVSDAEKQASDPIYNLLETC